MTVARGQIRRARGAWALAPTLALALLAAAALPCGAAADTATVTLGNSLTNPNNVPPSICTGSRCTVLQISQPGATLTAPADGTIVSWSYRSSAAGSTYALRVLRPTPGGSYLGAGTSAGATVPNGVDPTGTVEGPIATSLPVKAGDRIGLDLLAGPGVPIFQSSNAADVVGFYIPNLGDGALGAPGTSSDQQILVQATEQYPTAAGGGGGGGGGTGPGGGSGPGAGSGPPILSGLTISPTEFAALRTGGPVFVRRPVRRPRRAPGATVTYSVSEAATTRFQVFRTFRGVSRRRRGGVVCVPPAPTPRARLIRRCRGLGPRVGLPFARRTSRPGSWSFGFTGRVRGKGKLEPGTYRLRAVANSVSGFSGPATVDFHITP